jgi:hypothetical protein
VRPAWPALANALASVEMTVPIWVHKSVSKEAPVVHTCAKLVAQVVFPVKSTPVDEATMGNDKREEKTLGVHVLIYLHASPQHPTCKEQFPN